MTAVKLNNYNYHDYLDIDKTTDEKTRVELIFGEIYMMSGCSAKHQDIAGNIFFNLKLKKTIQCYPRLAPYDIKINLSNEINIVQPDVMIFCENEIMPCAVFEVLSPSTARKDKSVKKDLYELAKIKEYYIINTDLEIIDKYLLDNGKYYYERGYSPCRDETVKIECIDANILVSDIFENIKDCEEKELNNEN